jgi:hypothetical protein
MCTAVSFPVTPGLLRMQVIVQTARFVRANTPQVEIMLRVKQARNPLFGFLSPADPLHVYYHWMLAAGIQLVHHKDSAPGAQHKPAPVPAPAHDPTAAAAVAAAAVYGPALPSPGFETAASSDAEGGDAGSQHALALLTAYSEDAEELPAAGPAAEHAAISPTTPQGSPLPHGPSPAPAADAGTEVQQEQQTQQQPAQVEEAPEEPGVPGVDEVPGGRPPPPAATRTIITKLVAFVHRNGAKFEAVVRRREASNPKFSFLLPWNEHHWYYRWGGGAAGS